jgi:hypothetical protein
VLGYRVSLKNRNNLTIMEIRDVCKLTYDRFETSIALAPCFSVDFRERLSWGATCGRL